MEERMKSVLLKTGLSEKAVRLYIDKGMVHPTEKISGNRRNFFFSEAEIKRLKEIAILRKYGFTLSDIKMLCDNETCASDVYSNYIKEINSKSKYYNDVKKIFLNVPIESVKDKDSLIKILYEAECIRGQDYVMRLDENIDENICEKGHLVKCKIIRLIIMALICILFGVFLGFRWGMKHMLLESNAIKYGISGQNLHIHSVLWKDYPAWREVTFSIDGSISFFTKQNESITLDMLTNPADLKETQRKHNVSTNGKDLIYYDDVTYVIHDGTINAIIPKVYNRNSIIYTIDNSFYLVFREKDTDYIAGSISLLDTKYTIWTEEEAYYFDMNLDAYLSAFTLSDTYDNINPLHEKTRKEEIFLRKEEGNFLNCTIYNKGTDGWRYEAQPPHIELWYKGVWIELISPFAHNLTLVMVEKNEDKRIDIPEEIIMQYPTLIDGIYRLVIYGENEEFVVSDTFIMEG